MKRNREKKLTHHPIFIFLFLTTERMKEPSPSANPVIFQGSNPPKPSVGGVEKKFVNCRLVGKANFFCDKVKRLKLQEEVLKLLVNIPSR